MFKIRPGYSLRKILDTYVVVSTDGGTYMPNRIMNVNETGAVLWDALKDGADRAQLTERLLGEFDVDRETAESDIGAFLAQLREQKLLEEC